VREALGRRLNRLTEETNELLQVAAIIGRDFTYDTLTLLGDRDDDALLKMVEEALDARVIEETEQAGRYRFTHAQMQETLLQNYRRPAGAPPRPGRRGAGRLLRPRQERRPPRAR
jgi:predicted ATPase